ncbi:MAG TPA: S8 family serine peptidase [Planctomycetaceae bacterium]|nr:S8 family serine peptidase [Planctomycetaceae bacterium]
MLRTRERLRGRLWLAGLWIGMLAGLVTPADSAPPADVEVLIAFQRTPGANEHALIQQRGGKIRHSFTIVPALAARLPAAALAALAKHPDVVLIEPDGVIEAVDAELDAVWGVNRVRADVAQAASPSYRGLGVNVAVLDTGVDYNHPDLAANYRGGYDFVNYDSNPFDDNGHGTHVAGTIAAADNNIGVVGVAPSVNLYALKVLDSTGFGSFSNMIAALDWCVTNGIRIDVANHSYGSSSDPGSIVQQAFDNAYAAGILNIAAAGNTGTAGGAENNVIYPARYASVLAVGATNGSDLRASFSSTGPAVAVAAPGDYILSTLPNNGYGNYSGTSMACPHVVGAAAVLLEAGRATWGSTAISNDYLWDVLTMSAQDLGTTGVDTWYGSGLVRIDYGLNAVSVLQPSSPPPPPPSPTIKVGTVSYAQSGPKKRDLVITVTIVDQNGAAVSGASVSTAISCTGVATAYGGTKTTDSSGKATFKITNAPKGTWTTGVNNVSKSGCQWDGNKAQASFSSQ